MPLVTRSQQRLAVFGAVILLALLIADVAILWSEYSTTILYEQWLPSVAGAHEQRIGNNVWQKTTEPTPYFEVRDKHPIKNLMREGDKKFEEYIAHRSKNFKETVRRYRETYGRHPPPGFKQWYKLARKRKVYNIDDFQQIHDDLRPFWALPPREIRNLAAHASDDDGHALSTISIRNGQVNQRTWGWRSETFIRLLGTVAEWLPDMDIPMNRMDQPRVIVPWEDMQRYLEIEEKTRSTGEAGVRDGFTKDSNALHVPRPRDGVAAWIDRWNPFQYGVDERRGDAADDPPPPDYGWFGYPGGQYMDLAAKACPPESYARKPSSTKLYKKTEASYKDPLGGFITNFNLSSDLCTVGPQIQNLHGLLYASTSLTATHKLVPVFGECKVNVNNDILFPANMYWKDDERYNYDDHQDLSWDDKNDMMIWRGVTSGGNTHQDDEWRWRNMHRHRLVLMTNSTEVAENKSSIVALTDPKTGEYGPKEFRIGPFAEKHTDIGFTGLLACIPNCDFYNPFLSLKNSMSFAETFRSKYLIDVDGHSFSGRWRAFLQSRSLGLKATIFREWHDSRLFAWRHFVPVDNRYDDLYSLLAYFMGVGPSSKNRDVAAQNPNHGVSVWRHDYEALKLAQQGREWADKVLRREDIELYVFRLLLEYGRIIDDNRHRIGVVGDGGAEMEAFDREYPAVV
ncbi:glycosyltransferase family 90 [Lecanosticta acicola]|uniref:Glycosyltransferase family 90 n=1 Tax=Lecanosticta acicola TaxID=111012 RepID=A0AAI9EDF9_9PEZI|nr:glycosyltransferase family 90 [Lecanosticta acicola]